MGKVPLGTLATFWTTPGPGRGKAMAKSPRPENSELPSEASGSTLVFSDFWVVWWFGGLVVWWLGVRFAHEVFLEKWVCH